MKRITNEREAGRLIGRVHDFAGRTSNAPAAIRIRAAPTHLVLHHEEADAAAWAHTAVDATTNEAMDETAGYTSAAPAATDIRAGAAPTDRGHAGRDAAVRALTAVEAAGDADSEAPAAQTPAAPAAIAILAPATAPFPQPLQISSSS